MAPKITEDKTKLEKRVYNLDDLTEWDHTKAPSLDLPGLVTKRYFTPTDEGKYMLFVCDVDKKNEALRVCPNCGSINIKFDGYTSPRLVHDCSRNNYRIDIIVRPPRVRCMDCQARCTAPIPGIEEGKQSTTRLDKFLRTECFIQPFTILSERSGFGVDTISLILQEEADKLDAERAQHPLEAPRVLGIDEKHLGHDMRGTLVNIETGKLLDILPDNKQDTMRKGIQLLHGWDTQIQVVTTDMNNSYLSWLNVLLPNAIVVVDKFHVMQDVSKKTTTCRKTLSEYRKALINKEENPEIKNKHLALLNEINKHPRLFNYSSEHIVRSKTLKTANIIASAIDAFPEFGMLWNFRHALECMYQCDNYKEAEQTFDTWQSILPPSGQKAYSEWCKDNHFPEDLFAGWRSFTNASFLRFKPFILNYFKEGCRVTNAATEGLNRLIDQIQTNGNGYSFGNLRAKCLYSSLIHERALYGISASDAKQLFQDSDKKHYNILGCDFSTRFKWYTFYETHKPCHYPTPNVYSDNAWIEDILQPRDMTGLFIIRSAISVAIEKSGNWDNKSAWLMPLEQPEPTNQVDLIPYSQYWDQPLYTDDCLEE